tara:strand:- start:69 stop:278 length:210 start_codon:yes stop_codon:yes gene_type:complete
MYKFKENKTMRKAVKEGFFSSLKKSIRSISDKKIDKLHRQGNKAAAAFLKDFKKNPNKYIKKYEKDYGF